MSSRLRLPSVLRIVVDDKDIGIQYYDAPFYASAKTFFNDRFLINEDGKLLRLGDVAPVHSSFSEGEIYGEECLDEMIKTGKFVKKQLGSDKSYRIPIHLLTSEVEGRITDLHEVQNLELMANGDLYLPTIVPGYVFPLLSAEPKKQKTSLRNLFRSLRII